MSSSSAVAGLERGEMGGVCGWESARFCTSGLVDSDLVAAILGA